MSIVELFELQKGQAICFASTKLIVFVHMCGEILLVLSLSSAVAKFAFRPYMSCTLLQQRNARKILYLGLLAQLILNSIYTHVFF